MRDSSEQIILDLQVNASEAIAGIKRCEVAVAALVDAQKQLTESGKKNSAEYTANKEKIKLLREEMRSYEKELRNEIKSNAENTDSLRAMRAEMSNLNKQFDSLSKADREGMAGEALKQRISALATEIKTAEAETQRFYRNVGNYPKSFELAGASMNKLKASMAGMVGLGGNVGKAMGVAAGGIKGLGTAFVTPPMAAVNAVVTVLAMLINKLSEAFKKNDDAGTALQAAFAALQPIMTAVSKVFEMLAVAVGNTIEKFSKGVGVIANWVAGLMGVELQANATAKATADLVKAQDALEDKEREYTVNTAKREKDINRLKTESRKLNQYTAQERLDMMREAARLEKIDLEEQKKIAAERFRLAKENAQLAADTSDETKNKLAELEAAMHKAESTYYAGLQRLTMQTTTAEKEIAAERAARYKAYLEQQKEILKTTETLEKTAQQMRLDAMAEGAEKEILIFEKAQKDKIKQLQSVAVYTKAQAQERARLVDEYEKATAAGIAAIKEKYRAAEEQAEKERLQKLAEAEQRQREQAIRNEQERLKLLLDIAEKGSAVELELKKKQLAISLQQELESKELTEEKKLAITEKYRLLELQAQRAFELEKINRQNAVIEDETKAAILRAGENAEKIAAAELEGEKAKLDALLQLDADAKAAKYASEEQYTNAVLEQQNKIKNAQQKATNATMQQAKELTATAGAFATSMQDIYNTLGEDSAEFAAFSKMITLYEIMLTTAEAVALAVKTATSGGDPYTIAARVAAAVASVTAMVATAVKLANSAQAPTAPKFANGGLVTGEGTGTSDSILARVSNGEFVVNARSTASNLPLLQAINSNANAATTGDTGLKDILIDAFVEGVKSMPSPVVSVVDINNGQRRVKALEHL